MELKNICRQVQEVARKAGAFIANEADKFTQKDIQLKDDASLVTYIDRTAEKQIVEGLQNIIPNSGFITEEGTAKSNNEAYRWIIDPLDGTTNYLHGLAPHSVSIALMHNSKIILGVVYEISHNEMFYAWENSPAYCNNCEIKVATAYKLRNTLIATGFPYYDFSKMQQYIKAMQFLMQNTRGLRRFGSAAVDLCYVAAGRFDAFFEHSLHAWDVAAGAFIVQQAGGKIVDFNGNDNWLFGGEMVASSNNFFPQFFSVIQRYLGNVAAK